MTGKNDVVLEGFLKFPELKETRNNNVQFQGKVAVPFSYKDRETGQQKEGSKYVRICAWGDTANELGALPEGTPVRVRGGVNERSYESNCKSCGSAQKKSWTDILVNNVVVLG